MDICSLSTPNPLPFCCNWRIFPLLSDASPSTSILDTASCLPKGLTQFPLLYADFHQIISIHFKYGLPSSIHLSPSLAPTVSAQFSAPPQPSPLKSLPFLSLLKRAKFSHFSVLILLLGSKLAFRKPEQNKRQKYGKKRHPTCSKRNFKKILLTLSLELQT